MKFAHLADLHLGSWREEKLRLLSTQAFLKAIELCREHQVDFILFSGDLFNTSIPSLDTLKVITKSLKELKDSNILVYAIAGSHDFSPSGKTMLDVLENAGLLVNVCKGQVDSETHLLHLRFTQDQKTGAKITGMLGKKGLLDRVYYQNLSLENLEKEPGYKIFLFHTTLSELKPKHLERMESYPLSFLPKNFNYYAGGHVHYPARLDQPDYGILTYPGPLFPNNFSELEQLGKGGFYMVSIESNGENFTTQLDFIPLIIVPHHPLTLKCAHLSPEEITAQILKHFEPLEVKDNLITIRLEGDLEKGKVADIDFKSIFEQLYSRGAYFVMKNTSQLETESFSEIKLAATPGEDTEERIIQEHLQQIKLFDAETELQLTKTLLQALNTAKKEGENVMDFQKRVEQEVGKLLGV